MRPARPRDGLELVQAPRLKVEGLVRHWQDGALVAASCRIDGRVHDAGELQCRRLSPGGRALLCKAHAADLSRDYYAQHRDAVQARRRARRPPKAPQ